MSEYKLFVQRIGLVGLTNILISLSSLLLLPILTKQFNASGYGIWAQIAVTVSLIPNITNLGLPYTMVRFLSGEHDKKKIAESFYSILSLTFISTCIVSVFLFIFSNNIASALFNGEIIYVYVLIPIVFFACINIILLNFFRTIQRMKLYSIFLLLQTYIGVLLGSYLALSGNSLFVVVLSTLTSQVTVFLIMSILILGFLGFVKPKFHNLREYLSFGVPTVPNSLSSWVVNSSDTYVIGVILGTAFVGYYTPAYSLGNLLLMFLSPFAVLLPSLLPKYYDKGNYVEVKKYLKYSLKYYLLLTIPAAFGLSVLSKQILIILSTVDIALNGFLITPIICLGAIFMGIYGIISNILVLEKKTKIMGGVWIFAALFNLVFNILLVPHYGIMAAAIVTMISYLIAMLVTSYYSLKSLYFDLDLPFIAKSIFSSIVMAFIIILINPTGIQMVLLSVFLGVVIYTAIIFALKGVSFDELDFFKSMIKN